MGGRRGYSLKEIVGDIRKVKSGQKELLLSIKDKDTKKIVKATTKILGKSDEQIESLAYSFLFMDSIKKDYGKLRKESQKDRRKDLAKKWASFRKEKGRKFNFKINRNIVDSANEVLGGKNE